METSLLDKINSPADLKRLNIGELTSLCAEIRHFLVRAISETGGHLASNLGVVELSVALHYVFDTPEDKIIWDVGHQSYVHKLLTGRKDGFKNLRMKGGLSGFPKSAESEYDAFDTGHSSTALSAALGMALGRDLSGDAHSVIAVVGDGSMSGGLFYEALDHAGQLEKDMICVLNDNGMSISKSVGALSRHLSVLRTREGYIAAKRGLRDFLKKVPLAGKGLDNFLLKSKIAAKRLLVGGGIFENLGFNYIGPLNGHDLPALIKVLDRVRHMRGPILLHLNTIKGKGYDNAEARPGSFHGVGSFDIQTGKSNGGTGLSFSDVFGDTLKTLAISYERLAAITAAMPEGTGLKDFARLHPDRFFDVGIAEGHAVTFAAGLAKQGYIPVVAIYSTFLQRAYDNILHDVCIQNLHVIFAIDRAGVVGADGETHQGLFDLAYLGHMPNMRVMCPKDGAELALMLEFAVKNKGPWAIRYPKASPDGVFGCPQIEMSRSLMLHKGQEMLAPDIAIVALGSMVGEAYKAIELLEKDGLHPALYNARFAKPIDRDMIMSLVNYKYIITVEEHVKAGGFGKSVLGLFTETFGGTPLAFKALAFPDRFIPQGTRDEILAAHRMDAEGIYRSIKEFISL